jgi:putative aldouronate transport system permease protein
VVGTLLNIGFTVLGAYPLSRKYFYGRRFYMLAIVFTMLFNAGIIPSYLLVKSLGLLNTYWALWLPMLVSVWNLLIMSTFFQNIPEELEDAARIDGCSEFRLIRSIVIPLSMPVIATLALFYGVAHWNNFMSVMFYINDSSKYNLTVHVQNMMQNTRLLEEMSGAVPEAMNLPPEGVKSAGIFVLILPMLIVYPFLQKYFVKGVMIGSIKG